MTTTTEETPRPPPGPRGLRGLFAFTTFARDPLGFIERFTAAHPGAGTLPMMTTSFVYLNDPEAVGEVLLDRERRFSKDWTTRALDVVLGEGLLTSHGEHWRRQRQLVAPPLQRKQIAAYADSMARATERMVEAVPDGGELAVRPAMMKLTLEVVAETLFGANVEAAAREVAVALDEALAAFAQLIYTWRRMVPRSWPLLVRRRLREAAGRLHRVVSGIIDQRKAQEASDVAAVERDDLLGRLLRARDESGAAMSDAHLGDELVTILLAGHETTAMALCFALWFISQHPAAGARAREEIDSVLAGRRPGAEDVRRMPYLTAVVKETLRLRPPVWAFGREALEDVVVGRWSVRRGQQVLITPWASHRNPAHFNDPETFAPERWLEGLEERLPRHVYLPFGGGSRVCAGAHFAMMEAVILLAVLLQRLELSPRSGYQLHLQPGITLRPRDDLPMLVRHR